VVMGNDHRVSFFCLKAGKSQTKGESIYIENNDPTYWEVTFLKDGDKSALS